MDKHVYHLHTIKDNSSYTKKNLEELLILLNNKNYEVVMTFTNGDDTYFLLMGHAHEEPAQKKLN